MVFVCSSVFSADIIHISKNNTGVKFELIKTDKCDLLLRTDLRSFYRRIQIRQLARRSAKMNLLSELVRMRKSPTIINGNTLKYEANVIGASTFIHGNHMYLRVSKATVK